MVESKSRLQSIQSLQPGSLWQLIQNRTIHALDCGALQPLTTNCELIEQNGIQFVAQVIPNLARRDASKLQDTPKKNASNFNPFLPYEPDLFVADISETHLCLLNKFNVVDHHFLIVTRAFEDQEMPLTLEDFVAMWQCLTELDGLAFYNSGKLAGGSQRHRHLQIIPLPFASNHFALPITSVISQAQFSNGIGIVPAFPFPHALIKLTAYWAESPIAAGKQTLSCYYQLLNAVNLVQPTGELSAYNLLITREWMLIIPRVQACFESISINALGFAGAILVGDETQLQHLKEHSPMAVLRAVSGSRLFHAKEGLDRGF